MRSYPKRLAFAQRLGFSRVHAKVLARLETAAQIHDFINKIPVNFEPNGDTCLPAAEALRQRRAQPCGTAARTRRTHQDVRRSLPGCDLGDGWRQPVRNAIFRMLPPAPLLKAGQPIVRWTAP